MFKLLTWAVTVATLGCTVIDLFLEEGHWIKNGLDPNWIYIMPPATVLVWILYYRTIRKYS